MPPASLMHGIRPASEADSFSDMAMFVLRQLTKAPSSFVSLLQERQLGQLCAVCLRVDLHDMQALYREGDDSTFLGFIVSGSLELVSGTSKLLDLTVGDLVGEMELCNPVGGSSSRQHTLLASGDAVVARIEYSDFVSFFEGMGPRQAKRVSRHLADYVLGKVVKQEEDAELEDRLRLQNIGRTRRMAVSAPCSADLAIPHDSPRDADAAHDLHVPFYFENPDKEEMASIRAAIELVITRIPLLACLDGELKQQVVCAFEVAQKKTGQFIVHREQRQEYFFIIYRGECGQYEQVPWLTSQTAGQAAAGEGVARASEMRKDATPSTRHDSHHSGPESSAGRVPSNSSAANSQNFRRLPSSSSLASKSSFSQQSFSRKKSIISPLSRNVQMTSSGGASPLGSARSSALLPNRRNGGPKGPPGVTPDANDAFSRLSSSESIKPGGGVGDVALSMLTKGLAVKRAAKAIRSKSQTHHQKHFELVKTISTGEWFGDMGLVIESSSEINVKAIGEVTLLMLPVKKFREMREAWERRTFAARVELLRGSPFGKYLSSENLCNLADALVSRRVRAGENFINGESTDFYILQSGVAVQLKHHDGRTISSEGRHSRSGSPTARSRKSKILDNDPNKVREHREGACFCDRNLSNLNVDARTWIGSEPINPIINASTDCVFLVLDRRCFIDLIGSYDDLAEKSMKVQRANAEADLYATLGDSSEQPTAKPRVGGTQAQELVVAEAKQAQEAINLVQQRQLYLREPPDSDGGLRDSTPEHCASSMGHRDDAGNVTVLENDTRGTAREMHEKSRDGSRAHSAGGSAVHMNAVPPSKPPSADNSIDPLRQGVEDDELAMRHPSDGSSASLGRRRNIQFDPASVRPSSRDMRPRRRISQQEYPASRRVHATQQHAHQMDDGAAAEQDMGTTEEPDGTSTQDVASDAVSRTQSSEYLVVTSSGASAGYSDEFEEADQIDLGKDSSALQMIREQSEDLSSHDHVSVASFLSPGHARSAKAVTSVPEIESFIRTMVDSMYVEARAEVIALSDDEGGHDVLSQQSSRVESVTATTSDIPEAEQCMEQPEIEIYSFSEHSQEFFYESDDAEVLQLSPVMETPRSDGGPSTSQLASPRAGTTWSDGRTPSGVSIALKHAAAKLDDTKHERETRRGSEDESNLLQVSRKNAVDEVRPMSKGDHERPKSKGSVRVSRPATSGGSVFSATHSASRPTTGSGSGLVSASPADTKAVSRPNTSGGIGISSHPNTNSGLGIPRADSSSFVVVGLGSRPGTSGGLGLGSRPGTSGGHGSHSVGHLDLSRPTTVGSVPRTPGGNVGMSPQGMQSLPAFMSPSVTPSHSRCGSRQQSRAQSRGSGSRPASREVMPHKAERRSRASTSHLVSTDDEFRMPAQVDPALNDLYASDDEDIEAERLIHSSQTMSSKYALPAFVESTSEPHVREQAILPGGGEPAWTLEDAPPFKQQKPGTPDPSASHVRLAPARQPYQLLEEEEPFYQAQEQSLFPDDGYHYDDFYVEAPTLMTLDARVQAPLITAKTLSPNLVGRGSWSQDKSPQHPWMADVQRNGSLVPGPGMYSTPPRKKAGGRISDARPMMSEDLNRAVASRQPGPLEYADLGLKLPQGGRMNPPSDRPAPPGSHAGVFTRQSSGLGPGQYEVKSGIGTRPTTRIPEGHKTNIIEEIAKRRAFTPGPGHYKVVRDPTPDVLAGKQRLAFIKTCADRHRKRAVTAAASRASTRSAEGEAVRPMSTSTPVSVSLVLESMGGSMRSRSLLPDPELLCSEVRGGFATRRAYEEVGITI